MPTPSTRKVTLETVTPVGVLGVAVRTTMLYTVVAGEVIVMEDLVVGAVVVPPEDELLPPEELLLEDDEVPPEELLLEDAMPPEELLLDDAMPPEELLLDDELPPDELLLLLLPVSLVVEVPVAFAVVVVAAVEAGVGVVDVVLPPQPTKVADNAAVANSVVDLEQISLKVSYIADSPC